MEVKFKIAKVEKFALTKSYSDGKMAGGECIGVFDSEDKARAALEVFEKAALEGGDRVVSG